MVQMMWALLVRERYSSDTAIRRVRRDLEDAKHDFAVETGADLDWQPWFGGWRARLGPLEYELQPVEVFS